MRSFSYALLYTTIFACTYAQCRQCCHFDKIEFTRWCSLNHLTPGCSICCDLPFLHLVRIFPHKIMQSNVLSRLSSTLKVYYHIYHTLCTFMCCFRCCVWINGRFLFWHWSGYFCRGLDPILTFLDMAFWPWPYELELLSVINLIPEIMMWTSFWTSNVFTPFLMPSYCFISADMLTATNHSAGTFGSQPSPLLEWPRSRSRSHWIRSRRICGCH